MCCCQGLDRLFGNRGRDLIADTRFSYATVIKKSFEYLNSGVLSKLFTHRYYTNNTGLEAPFANSK